jgi:hypothetical protein
MRFRLLGLALLIAGTAAQAQTSIPVHVGIKTDSPNGFETEVIAAVKARIGSTSRYYLAGQVESNIDVTVLCLEAAPIRGGACAYTFDYFPKSSSSLHITLGGSATLITQPDAVRAAEVIFDDFVEATSPQKLATAQSMLETSVRTYQYQDKVRASKP